MSQHSRPFGYLHKVRGPGTKLQQGRDKGREATALPAECADAKGPRPGRQDTVRTAWVGAKGLRPGRAEDSGGQLAWREGAKARNPEPGNRTNSELRTTWVGAKG